MLKSRRFWIGITISAAFLALFFWQVDFSEMGRALARANYIYLIPALAVYYLGVWFRALRWRYLLLPLGKFSILYLFRLVTIGFALNDILPARLGIILRAYLLGEKEKVSKVAVFATVGVERIFDGLALILMLIVASSFVSLLEGDVTYWVEIIKWVSVGIFLLALFGLLFITYKPDLIRKIGKALIRHLPSRSKLKWGEWLDAAIIGLSLPRNKARLLAVSATSLLVWVCEGSTFYFLSIGFNIGQPYHAMLLVMCIATLSWVSLISPGGLGTYDWFGQQALIALRVVKEQASAFMLAVHAAQMLPIIALGFIFLWMEGLSFGKVIGKKVRLTEETESGGSEQ